MPYRSKVLSAAASSASGTTSDGRHGVHDGHDGDHLRHDGPPLTPVPGFDHLQRGRPRSSAENGVAWRRAVKENVRALQSVSRGRRTGD
jgi:hypothetical protein